MLPRLLASLCLLLPDLAAAQRLEARELSTGARVEAPGTSAGEASFVVMSMPMTLERVPEAERPGLPERVARAYARMEARGPQSSVWAASIERGGPALMTSGRGPMNVRLHVSQISANSAFSDRNP